MAQEPTKQTAYQTIEAALDKAGARLWAVHLANKKSPVIERFEMWVLRGGYSVCIHVNHNGGYQLYKQATDTLDIQSDIDFINQNSAK